MGVATRTSDNRTTFGEVSSVGADGGILRTLGGVALPANIGRGDNAMQDLRGKPLCLSHWQVANTPAPGRPGHRP